MQAHIGDGITVRGRRVGTPVRCGVVTAIRGEAGHPPFIVHWDDTEGEHLYCPGSDTLDRTATRTMNQRSDHHPQHRSRVSPTGGA
jgi:hypothetical protein